MLCEAVEPKDWWNSDKRSVKTAEQKSRRRVLSQLAIPPPDLDIMAVPFTAPGYHTVTPSLTIRGAAEALEFYKKALNAVEVVGWRRRMV